MNTQYLERQSFLDRQAVALIDLHPVPADLERLAVEGLSRVTKQLPAWFLYDAEGSRLFDAICRQPEYRLTATETALLEQEAVAMAAAIGPGLPVEFGAGSARKVSPLLEALAPAAYVALDISSSHRAAACGALQARHPATAVLGICCDYSQLQHLPAHPLLEGQRRIGFYPGSSLGNFEPPQAKALLAQFARLLGPDGCLLIGIDQPRAVASLEAAYNDRAGYSAAFASNLLVRLNRDLGGSFDPEAFTYRARWQPDQSRIEMALVSQRQQVVRLASQDWTFAPAEALITEYSYKYTPEAFAALAGSAGWRLRQRWSDPAGTFSLHLLEPQP